MILSKLTTDSISRLRTEDMHAMSEHKSLDERSIRHLVEAALTFDMISVKLEKLLTLELSGEPKASRKSNCKGKLNSSSTHTKSIYKINVNQV